MKTRAGCKGAQLGGGGVSLRTFDSSAGRDWLRRVEGRFAKGKCGLAGVAGVERGGRVLWQGGHGWRQSHRADQSLLESACDHAIILEG